SPQEASSGFRDLFEQSIRLHLRSDVPVGVSLSGGMDSSAITAMVRAVQGPEIPLHTFSYVAEDPELSEERWSGMVARAIAAMQFLRHAKALPTSAALSLRGVVRETLPATLVETVRRVRTRPPLGANADWFRERGIGSPRTRYSKGPGRSLHGLAKQNLLEA